MNTADYSDEHLVKYFCDLAENWGNATERIEHLSEVTRHREILAKMKKQVSNKIIRSSLLYKLLRMFDVQARHMPSTMPYKPGRFSDDLIVVEAFKDLIYEKTGAANFFASVVDRMKSDGQVWAQIGIDKGNIVRDIIEPYYLICDPQATDGFAESYYDRGDVHKTIIRRVGYKGEDFDKAFPDHKGLRGEPYMINTNIGKTTEQQEDDAKKNDTYVDYIYSIEFEEPIEMAIAGANKTVLYKKNGKDYRHVKTTAFGEVYQLPFVYFNSTTYRNGIFPLSLVGMIEDINEKYEKHISKASSLLYKIINKKILLTGQGAGDKNIQKELAKAEMANEAGLDYVVALEGNSDLQMRMLGADPAVINEFRAIKEILWEEASERFDINFRGATQDDVKATVYLGKSKSELAAIASVYGFNVDNFFNRLAELSVNCGKNKEVVEKMKNISIPIYTSAGSLQANQEVFLAVMKEWDGSWITDVEIKMPLSTPDLQRGLQELSIAFQNLIFGTPFKTIEEIMPIVNALYKRAALVGVDDIFSKESMLESIQSVIDGRVEQVNPADLANLEKETPEQGASQREEILNELSPNSMIAQSNLT